ncbi:MAG: Uma2 family endonuclease [Acidobacteriota bacterium]|nr:Uma2 family endonuclease [Acidobacteriota bacterium]
MPTETIPRRRLTYDDFVRFPDDGRRHEIIDGVHYVTPSPVTRHQLLVGRLHFALESYLRVNPGTGQVFLAPFDVVLSNWDVVEPDLLLIAADQPGILTAKNVQGPPALVIEVLSPGTRARDEQLKRALFERTGVREYWLVDPDTNCVGVLRRGESGFAASITGAAEGWLETPLLPGFRLSIAELFA